MFIFLIAVSVILIFYLVLICLLYRGLSKLRHGQNPSSPMVSVIVAARNEANRLPLCLDALSIQSYPSSLYEVIVIDDRSDDDTASVIKSFTGRHSNFRSVTISEQAAGMAPKKWALTQGIARARGSIFMVTDGDWL